MSPDPQSFEAAPSRPSIGRVIENAVPWPSWLATSIQVVVFDRRSCVRRRLRIADATIETIGQLAKSCSGFENYPRPRRPGSAKSAEVARGSVLVRRADAGGGHELGELLAQ